MQHICGLRSEQQRDAMTSVGANHDHVHPPFFGCLVNFDFWRSEDQMSITFFDLELAGKIGQVRRRLIVDLILNRREVHRNLAAITEAKWFDDMDDMQFGCKRIGHRTSSSRNMPSVFGQIGSQQNSLDLGHSPGTRALA